MNLIHFIDAVKEKLDTMSEQDKSDFIVKYAETLPESKREEFLASLSFREMKGKDEISQMKNDVLHALVEIHNGKLSLDSEWDEYDYDYDDDTDGISLLDPDGIGGILHQAAVCLHMLNDRMMYQDAYEIAYALSKLEIPVKGVYTEEFESDSLSVSEVLDDLDNIDKQQWKCDSLSAVFYGEGSPACFYLMCESFDYMGCPVRFLVEAGIEVKDLQDFLPQWIEYLCTRIAFSSSDENWLKEALTYITDQNVLLSLTEMYGAVHPCMLEYCLQQNIWKDVERAWKLLHEIDSRYMIRSRIALLIADKTEDRRLKEKCYLEAFRSDTDEVSYLRLRIMTENFDLYQQQVQEILALEKTETDPQMTYVLPEERRVNYYLYDGSDELHFFTCDFSYFFDLDGSFNSHCNDDLFLLYLYQEGDRNGSGMKYMIREAMLDTGFNKEEFYAGTGIETEETDQEVFVSLFDRWKGTVSMDRVMEMTILNDIAERWQDNIRGILKEQNRKMYDTAALWLAAFGEVLESRGVTGEKKRMLNRYAEEYGNYRRFMRSIAYAEKK